MPLANVLFFATFLSMWAALHVWVARRLVRQGREYPPWLRRMIWGVLVALAVVPMLGFFGRRLDVAGADTDLLQWVGFVFMGLSSLLITFTMIADTPRLVAQGGLALRKRWHERRGSGPEEPTATSDLVSPGRRKFFADVANYGIVGGATGLSAVGFVEARRVPRVVEVDVPITDLHPDLDGLRIVQLTDVHVGPTIRGTWLRKVVDAVNELDPDLVALTGDFVDGFVADLSPELAALADLRARHGSFFVTGNHEYYWDGPAWCAAINALGPTVLVNEHRVIERGDARLLLAGVTDLGAARHEPSHLSDPAQAKAGAPEHDLSLLLAHQPRSIYAAAKAGFDIQLSGHTHSGQYFPMSLLIHLMQPYVHGLARHEDTMIYVSAGTGYWGPPNRAGSPAEITLLTLRAASQRPQ
ncbi:putative metallophosphoesterase [Enhygromyxa salina]|uniref:Putative metallophosphoesterase n=1 Tax=Enhygromyxa salina TaxID=215803 RepID=A0A2S9Y7R1_9BACT|nr:metallophosphoesterase [Enhygromyxa salina]PRQ01066.1 putative metallophosphoesterase [Enhygromyxa salina]